MTDREILDRIYSDDIDGFILLVDAYADLIYKIVDDILYESDDKNSEECVSDTFLAFYNNIDDVDLSRGSIKGYLGVIARRRAINLYYTLFPDADEVFDEYTVEEMSSALETQEPQENQELSEVIKRLCLREIAPAEAEESSTAEDEECSADEVEEYEEPDKEAQDEPATEIVNKKSGGFRRAVKTLVAMVILLAVITVGIIAFDRLSVPEYVPPTTKATTQATTEPFNPLLSAITEGNEKLVEELIENSLLLTDEVLRFAVESADKISYDSIRRIAEEVRSKYGSTGLDPILDSAIFGDFKSVEERIKNKDESELTSAEKLAKFFYETFAGEAG